MKKIVFIFAVTLLVLISYKEMRGQDCPSGWQERAVQGYPQCPEAIIHFKVCCSITSGQVEFKFTRVEGCSGYYLPSVIDWLSARIKANYFEYCGVWVPCNPGPPKDVYIRKPLCFYENDQRNNDFLYCDESWCLEHWTVCDLGGGNLDWRKLSSQAIGNPYPGCLDVEYSDELQPGTCFHAVNCQ